jgi:folate-dependent phosphoribosylglycinamide formyltransferase PurN
VFSSSSGQTFKNFFLNLPPNCQSACEGFYVDRDCGAFNEASNLLGSSKVFQFQKKTFEQESLNRLKNSQKDQALIFLCGFFGILSENFLSQCPYALLNTHPSLLPAFPGLDQKVHQAVFEQSHFGGFSLHLVNEQLDGGALLFQKSVSLLGCSNWQEARETVRKAEQEFLPKIFPQILLWLLKPLDRHLSTHAVVEKFKVSKLYDVVGS